MLIFCILASLVVLSNVSSGQNESSDMVHTTNGPVTTDANIFNDPYIQRLRNPCTIDSSDGMPPTPSGNSRNKFPKFYTDLKKLALRRGEEAQQILDHLFGNMSACQILDIKGLDPVIAAELEEMEEEEALNKICQSLILHTAYSWAAHSQLNVKYAMCPGDFNSNQIARTLQLVKDLKQMACLVWGQMYFSGYEYVDIIPRLHEPIPDQCSRTMFFVCNALRKSCELLNEIEKYVVKKMSSVGNSTISVISTLYISSISVETSTSLYTLSS